jgi:ribonuclease BN (tRNA processing enzyme)
LTFGGRAGYSEGNTPGLLGALLLVVPDTASACHVQHFPAVLMAEETAAAMEATDSEAESFSDFLVERQNPGVSQHQRGAFTVRFWGVRGSYPVSKAEMLQVGGNTACIEVQVGGHELILDAGTGLIALGQRLTQQLTSISSTITILFSHLHYDHILGLPFFEPLYQPGVKLYLGGPRMGGRPFDEVLCQAITSPYFPVDLREAPATCEFFTLETGDEMCWYPGESEPTVEHARFNGKTESARAEEVRVSFLHSQVHPTSGCLVSRIEYGGRSLVFATDVENPLRNDQQLIEFARGADVLIHDAQYTEDAYTMSKRGFGHSTPQMATAVARAAGVKQLILFHHDPEYDDALLEQAVQVAQGEFSGILLAREGQELSLL